MGGEDDRQMQGAKRKSMLVDWPKSRHEYLQRKCTAYEERITQSGIQSVTYREFSFSMDVLQVCWLVDVCTAYTVKV